MASIEEETTGTISAAGVSGTFPSAAEGVQPRKNKTNSDSTKAPLRKRERVCFFRISEIPAMISDFTPLGAHCQVPNSYERDYNIAYPSRHAVKMNVLWDYKTTIGVILWLRLIKLFRQYQRK